MPVEANDVCDALKGFSCYGCHISVLPFFQ
jgi:hypothetical protein